MFVHSRPKNCVELEANKDHCWPGWKLVHTITWQTPRIAKVDLDKVATKLVHNDKLQTSNYWSPLACLVEEQDEHVQENHTKVKKAKLAIVDGQPTNKVAAHWAQKINQQKVTKVCLPRLRSNIQSSPRGRQTRPQWYWWNLQENIHFLWWMHGKSNKENAPQA